LWPKGAATRLVTASRGGRKTAAGAGRSSSMKDNASKAPG
jgi:hypothetical protein